MKENKFILTENVFLDSSVFEEQNFISGTKIHSLFYYSQVNAIKIHNTTISKMELFNRIDKRISECRSEIKKINSNLNGKNVRIVKNLGFFKKIDIPEIEVAKHSKELKKKIERFFDVSNVNTIKTSNIPITDIVNNYYLKKPPFHNAGKQNEFIDAFILKSLEQWCERNKTKMYVLSKDNDFLGYKSDYLIMIKDISNLLEQISKYYNQKYKLNRITQVKGLIKKNKSDLETLSIDLISEKVSVKSKQFDISRYEIESSELKSYKIITFRKDITEVECVFKIKLFFYVFEDNDFKELVTRKVIHDFEIPLYIEINNEKVIDIKWLVENMELIYEE